MGNSHKVFLAESVLVLLAGCGSGGSRSATPQQSRAGERLVSFAQELMSPQRNLNVQAGQSFAVPVNVKNAGTQPWFGGEAKPMTVDVGYRWVDSNGTELQIEGNRTQLTRSPLSPGESEDVNLAVTAPARPGNYTLRISIVQEGVEWFYKKGAKPLDLRVNVS